MQSDAAHARFLYEISENGQGRAACFLCASAARSARRAQASLTPVLDSHREFFI